MSRRFAVHGLVIACAMLLIASRAPAAEDILKLVPDSAWGLVVINRPAAVEAKAQAFARQVQLPPPKLLAMLKQMGMDGGVDTKGTAALLVLPPQGKDPIPAAILLVPVTDYGKFVAQFQPKSTNAPSPPAPLPRGEGSFGAVTAITLMNKPARVRNIGGYAALTDSSHQAALEKTLQLAKEIPPAMAPWRKWLNENDVAAIILRPGIERGAVEGQTAIQRTKASFAQMAASQKGEMAEQLKTASNGFDLYAKVLQAAEKEVAAYGLGLQLDKQGGLRLVSRTSPIPGGELARILADIRPAKGNLLDSLPAAPYVVACGFGSTGMFSALMKFEFDLLTSMPMYGLKKEQAEKLVDALKQMTKRYHGISMVMGVGKGDAPIFSNMIGVYQVDDAQASMASYEKDFKKYAGVLKDAKSPMLPTPAIEKDEVAGNAAWKVTMKMPLTPPQVGLKGPQYAQIMKAYFGSEGKMVVWMAPADEHRLVTGFGSKEPVERVIAAIKQGQVGLAGDAGVAKTAAMLPARAWTVAFLSPAGVIELINRIAPIVMPPQVKFDLKLPEFGKTPPIGFAVTAGKEELRTYLVVPGEVVRAIGQYVGKVRAMHGGAPK